MNTEAVKPCPQCKAPISAEAPQGLCPNCLLASVSIPTEPEQPAGGAEAPSLQTVAAGFPHLEILQFIGQGGMGVVFKARQPKLDRLVALKLLPQKSGADPSFGERFRREARVLARLNHPNIVAVHDFGEAGPFYYLLMEFVDGVNLRQAMQAERFTPAQALALVPRICDALQYAHDEGVLHRDIKPENLLLDKRGRVKIADFGIAKLLGEARDITLTAHGAAVGTPHYMAPEQLERPHDVDQRADVYSLGVVFYEMLTGELPIGRFAPPSEKAAVDPRVDQVVLRTLEKERERRFQSAGDVKTQMERIAATPTETEGSLASTTPKAASGAGLANQTSVITAATRRWSWRAFAAGGLVGFSLLATVLAMLGEPRIGRGDLPFLFGIIGVPAVAGTLFAWRVLRAQSSRGTPERGSDVALLAAMGWPMFLLDVGVLVFVARFARSFLWHVLRLQSSGIVGLLLITAATVLLVLNAVLVRRWCKQWQAKMALPHTEIRSVIGRMSPTGRWLTGSACALMLMVAGLGQAPLQEPVEATLAPVTLQPSPPPGVEVPAGNLPGDDGRLYRTTLTVPGGYALTASAVLYSNQTLLKNAFSNGVAVLVAPNGAPVHGSLTWRLLGNTTFADGAPVELAFSFDQAAEHPAQVFHLVPPEPITIDWVGEPAQLWPPPNGHTRFLILKGTSESRPGEVQFPVEWSVALETRLDPIPAEVLDQIKGPAIKRGGPGLAAAPLPAEN